MKYDLTSSKFASNIENLTQYIPNTAQICRTHQSDWEVQALLVSINTGYVYDLDIYTEGESPNNVNGNQNSIRMIFGHDEISQTDIQVEKEPGRNRGTATLNTGNANISLIKMKEIFCDDCIRNILQTVENGELRGFVIFDVESQKLYPVKDSTLQIGDYNLDIHHTDRQYEI